MCASPLRGAAGPVWPGRIRIASVGVLLPIFFVLSVIHAEAALANASTGICLLQLRMERRMKPAVTVQMLP